MKKYNEPLIITGCPRTGTTGLQMALSALPGICIWYELELYSTQGRAYVASMDRLKRMIERHHGDGPYTKKEILERPFLLRNPLAQTIPISEIRKLVEKVGPDAELSTLQYVLFQMAELSKGSLRLYGDKTPLTYCDQLPEVFDEYPDARVIFCIRDGRDAVTSLMTRKHEPQFAADWWIKCMEGLEAALMLPSLRDRIMTVRLEEAVKDRAKVFRDIAAFVGLDDHDGDEESFVTFYNPIHVGRWKAEQPDLESKLDDRFINALRQWGYE
ncbi:MAG: sulfotransferase [Deltaproteobacteria bacterium]|nr:sulfotransferase [Deltaproteobacteria bacterium]